MKTSVSPKGGTKAHWFDHWKKIATESEITGTVIYSETVTSKLVQIPVEGATRLGR